MKTSSAMVFSCADMIIGMIGVMDHVAALVVVGVLCAVYGTLLAIISAVSVIRKGRRR